MKGTSIQAASAETASVQAADYQAADVKAPFNSAAAERLLQRPVQDRCFNVNCSSRSTSVPPKDTAEPRDG